MKAVEIKYQGENLIEERIVTLHQNVVKSIKAIKIAKRNL